MILKGSQRGGGKALALHLMNGEQNEHVEVHEVKGFLSNSVSSAFKEAHAVSKGTASLPPGVLSPPYPGTLSPVQPARARGF